MSCSQLQQHLDNSERSQIQNWNAVIWLKDKRQWSEEENMNMSSPSARYGGLFRTSELQTGFMSMVEKDK